MQEITNFLRDHQEINEYVGISVYSFINVEFKANGILLDMLSLSISK